MGTRLSGSGESSPTQSPGPTCTFRQLRLLEIHTCLSHLSTRTPFTALPDQLFTGVALNTFAVDCRADGADDILRPLDQLHNEASGGTRCARSPPRGNERYSPLHGHSRCRDFTRTGNKTYAASSFYVGKTTRPVSRTCSLSANRSVMPAI